MQIQGRAHPRGLSAQPGCALKWFRIPHPSLPLAHHPSSLLFSHCLIKSLLESHLVVIWLSEHFFIMRTSVQDTKEILFQSLPPSLALLAARFAKEAGEPATTQGHWVTERNWRVRVCLLTWIYKCHVSQLKIKNKTVTIIIRRVERNTRKEKKGEENRKKVIYEDACRYTTPKYDSPNPPHPLPSPSTWPPLVRRKQN